MSQGHKFSRFVFLCTLVVYPSHILSSFLYNKQFFIFLKDANTIKKVFSQRKTEIEQAEPTKSSLRIRYVLFS